MANVVVFGPKVLIDRHEIKTECGLIIPDNARSMKLDKGTVLQIGPEVHEYCDLQVGDVVVWGRYAEGIVVIDDQKLVIVNADALIYREERSDAV